MAFTVPSVSPYERTVMHRVAKDLEGASRFIQLALEDCKLLQEDGMVEDLHQLDTELRRVLEDWTDAHDLHTAPVD